MHLPTFGLRSTSADTRVGVLANPSGECEPELVLIDAWARNVGIVVARVPGFGTARLRIDVDDQAMLPLAGDGVVIASPTGSTAYTLGADGPAVAPTLDAIVLTPLASQGSPLRPLVVDGTDAVRVTREPSSAPLSIEVDGRRTVEVTVFASLEVHAAPHKARLLRTRPGTFYADLAERL